MRPLAVTDTQPDGERRRSSDRYVSAQKALAAVLSGSATVDQAIPEVLKTACRGLGWDWGALWEAESQGRVLRCLCLWQAGGPRLERLAAATRGVSLSAGGGLVGSVFASGQPCWTADLQGESAHPRTLAALKSGMRSALVFPVTLGRRAVGVIELFSSQSRVCDETLIQLLAMTGSQIGQFIGHKRVEATLRDSEERHRLLFSSVSEAIVVFDFETRRIADCNEAAVKLYGHERGALLAMEVEALLARGEPPAEGALSHEAACRTRVNLRYQRKRDGTVFPAEITTAAFKLKDRLMGIAVARDISERKKAEENERLRQSERMQREFVATVSHEFRTPVAAIKGFAETLRNGGIDDAVNRLKFVGIIEKHAQRLSRLVEDILDLCALESGRRPPKPEKVCLSQFSRKLGRSLAPLLKRKRLSLRVDIPAGLKAGADKAQLAQVFNNLLSNAIKFSRRGGRILVEGRGDSEAQVRLSVRDYGVGIMAEDLPHVFERFNRPRRDRARKAAGTGLGLSIVKQILEAHGGRIWVESSRGEGSAFHFTLPRCR